MPTTDWSTLFENSQPSPGATAAELEALADRISAPLSPEEIEQVNRDQKNPFPPGHPLQQSWQPFDPAAWTFPKRPLPETYLSFLRWSNGGTFSNGDRHFVPLYGTADIRSFMLGFHIPEYLPGAIPFGWDGSEQFYLFDMREDSTGGEYPIVFANAGNLDWPAAILLGHSFVDVCRDRTDPVELARRSMS